MKHTPIKPFNPDKDPRMNSVDVVYHLTNQDMLEIWQAGASGTDEPTFEEFMMKNFPTIFI